MSDIVKWMQSINDGSALTDSLREVRELKAEVERLKGVLVRLTTPTNISADERIAIAQEALEAKP